VNDALSWFSKDEEFQSVVNESAPLLAGPAGLARANAFLSPFFFLVPLASGGLAWRFRHQADRLLLLGWTLALFVATLVQWRFMNSYSIAQSLVLGLVWTSGREALASNLTTRTRRVCAAVLAIGLLAATFQPAVRSYAPHWRNVLRSWRGERTDPIGTLWQARILAEAARFLRDHSPDREAARYSVLAPWGDGHLLQYVARRAVVQDNFGDDVAPENFGRAEAYFAARSESEALRIVSPLETRYVLVRSTGSGHGHGYAEDSQFAKLYRWRGSLGAPVAGGDQPTAPIEALHRHRLIYQSEPLHRGDAHPYVLLFEIVAGAELVGRAPADAIVSASLAIEPDRGRRFFYTTRTRADAAGRFTLRLPYATGTDAAGVRTGDRYHLSAGEGAAEVAIPEAAVLEGTRIEAPALSPEGR
jgi:asparagine N-glycosylation enzyme membrane subunit Stt3